jgi:hypothetical protein
MITMFSVLYRAAAAVYRHIESLNARTVHAVLYMSCQAHPVWSCAGDRPVHDQHWRQVSACAVPPCSAMYEPRLYSCHQIWAAYSQHKCRPCANTDCATENRGSLQAVLVIMRSLPHDTPRAPRCLGRGLPSCQDLSRGTTPIPNVIADSVPPSPPQPAASQGD